MKRKRHGPRLLELPTHLTLEPNDSLKQQKSACAWDETSLQKPKVAFQTAREKGSRKRGNPLPVSCKKAKQLSKKKPPMWLHPCRRVLCQKKKTSVWRRRSHGLQNWTHGSSVAKLEVCQLTGYRIHKKLACIHGFYLFFIRLSSFLWKRVGPGARLTGWPRVKTGKQYLYSYIRFTLASYSNTLLGLCNRRRIWG